MAYLRAPIVVALSFAVLVPDVAFARREPGVGDAPAAAAQPVAPAAAAPAPAVAPVTPAPVTAAPVTAAPVTAAPVAAAPVAAAPVTWDAPAQTSAPAPAPVVSPRTHLPPPRPAPYVPSNGKANAMLASGLGLFGGVYFFTSLSGAIIIDKARDGELDAYTGVRSGPDKRRINYGRGLLVPVVGPFISLAYTDSARERWAASFSGLAQVGGAVLLLAGVIAKGRIRRAQRLGWAAGGIQGGGAVTVSGRF
jgi:hypothetical protein